MIKKMMLLIFTILFGLAALQADPIDIDSDYGWKMLTIPASPSISAMAGTGAAISGEAGSFIEHPAAGLIGNLRSVSINQNLWIFDTQMNSIAINTSSGINSYGFALRALDYGKIEARDITGEVIGEFHPLDLNLIANYARRFGANYYAGANLMPLYQKLQSNSSTGLALDLGLSYLPPIRGLTLNAAIRHIGMTSKVNEERINLPTAPEIGFSYLLPLDFAEINAEYKMLKLPDDSNIRVQLGTNININDIFNIRGGYYLNHDTQSLTAGIGLHIRKIDFNYAYLPFSDNIGDAHSFGLTYKF